MEDDGPMREVPVEWGVKAVDGGPTGRVPLGKEVLGGEPVRLQEGSKVDGAPEGREFMTDNGPAGVLLLRREVEGDGPAARVPVRSGVVLTGGTGGLIVGRAILEGE